MTAIEIRLHALFEELVPPVDKAGTVAGEIVRAITRIAFRNRNDGDHIGYNYGCQTCNAAARYLMAHCNDEVRKTITDMWGMQSDRLYDAALNVLERQVVDFLDHHPELRDTENQEDMLDYYIREEDALKYDEED